MRYTGLILLGCTCIFGQGENRSIRELALTKTVDGGITIIHLLNEYSFAATAWIVECHSLNEAGTEWASQSRWDDEELGLEGKPLGAQKETEFRMPARPNVGGPQAAPKFFCENYQVIAAVFADGSVSGDLRWVNAIAADRRKTYQDIAKATDMLKKAESEGTERPKLIQQFVDWQTAEAGRARPGKPAPNHGVSSSWSSRTLSPGQQLPESNPMSGLFARAAVPGATIWLLQEKEKKYSDAVQVLSEWRDRLGKFKPATETEAPSTISRMRTAPGTFSGPQPVADLVSKPAPEFTLKDVDGHEFALKDLLGKTVFLNFWATWCAPCREEMPLVKRLHDEFSDKGLVVVSINLNEGAETARKYFTEQKYPFRNLLDPQKKAVDPYSANSIPTVVLIDKEGIVRYQHRGYGPNLDLRSEVVKLGMK